MAIKNIIFDLGGVLLNISYQVTINGFKKLGVKDFDSFYNQAAQMNLFDQFDKGEISPQGFRDELKRISGLPLSDDQIDRAWNAMLLDFPTKHAGLLKGVRKNYRTFLLSNTNAIHYPVFMDYLGQNQINGFDALFEKCYLSYEIGMRKPDRAIFEHVINDSNLDANETLFIDDSIQHVKGACGAGLRAVHLDPDKMEVGDLFSDTYMLTDRVSDLTYKD